MKKYVKNIDLLHKKRLVKKIHKKYHVTGEVKNNLNFFEETKIHKK